MMKKVRIVGVLLICFLLTGSDNYLKESRPLVLIVKLIYSCMKIQT